MSTEELFPGYCIDTSAIIDLWRRQYPRDVFPSLWRSLESLISNGYLIAPREVSTELKKRDDQLFKWAEEHRGMFRDLDEDQQHYVREILSSFPDFAKANKETPEADPFVIALARAKGWSVISSERHANPGERPKIPDVCERYGIRHLQLLDFFRDQHWAF